jgi:glycosyltransferase 2 family protein
MTEQLLEPDAPAAPAPKRGLLKVLIRIGVSAGVLAFLLVKADVSQLWHTLRTAQVPYLIGAVASIFAGLGVSALRWKAYLDALELSLAYGTLFRLYFVGTFFNAFLPTGIGGDAYKAVRLGRDRDSMAPAFASVFLDRFAGIVAMGAVGLVSSAYLLASRSKDSRGGYPLPIVALLLSGGVLAAAVVLLWGGERLLGKGRLVKHEGIGGRLRRAMRSIHAAGRHPDAAARGYLFGAMFQGLVFLYHLMIGRALNITGVPILAYASMVVVASLATMIPLSINGLGFRESAYIWALGRYGVSHDQALAFALVVLGLLILTSLSGGLVYVSLGGEVHGPRLRPGEVGSPPPATP